MDGNWDDLRVFLSVARRESVSAAGRHLRLDPATVGRRIQRLETALGSALFAKSPQGYALTDAGQRLLAFAEEAEQALAGGADAIAGHSGGLAGQVRVGAPDGLANFVLPQVCAAISAENPDLDIQIVALPRVMRLSKREVDMAITVSAPTTGRLTVQKVADYNLVLAAHADYLAVAPEITNLEDLKAHPLVGYIQDMIFDKELDYLSELPAERVALASNSASVQLRLIAQGAGVGIVHSFSLAIAPGLRRVLSDSFVLKRAFYLVRPADDRRVERLTRFASALSAGVAQEIQRLEAKT